MIAHSIQISELLPDSFVKIILNTGKHKYGYIQNSAPMDNQVLLFSSPDSTKNFNEMSFEMIDSETVVSIDSFMK